MFSLKRFLWCCLFLMTQISAQPVADAFMFPIDNSHIRFNGYYFGQPLWNDLYHMGEDYDALPGTPVKAIARGTVKLSKSYDSVYGQVIAIEHLLPDGEKVVSIYGHLSRKEGYPLIGLGPIEKGKIVGYVGWDSDDESQDENGDGPPHLHLGIRKGAYNGLIEGRAYSLENFYKPSEFILNQINPPQIPIHIADQFDYYFNLNGGESAFGAAWDNGHGPGVHWWPDEGGPEALPVRDHLTDNNRWTQLVYNAYQDSVHAIRNRIFSFWREEAGYSSYGPPIMDEMTGIYVGTSSLDHETPIGIQIFSKSADMADRKTIVTDSKNQYAGAEHIPVGLLTLPGIPGDQWYIWVDGVNDIFVMEIESIGTASGWIDAGDYIFLRKRDGENQAAAAHHVEEGNCQIIALNPGPVGPVLSVSTTALSFNSFETQKTFTIANEGTEDLNWNIVTDQTWIICSPVNGTNNDTIEVVIDRSGLTDGEYTGTIQILSADSSEIIQVSMTVRNDEPKELSVSTDTLDFGLDKKTLTFQVKAPSKLNWQIDNPVNWILFEPQNGSGSSQISVTINRDLMKENEYTAFIDLIYLQDQRTGIVVLAQLPDPSMSEETPGRIPDAVELYQNYPNPFNPKTTILFSVPRTEFVRLKLFDIAGKEIKNLMETVVCPGEHRVELHSNGLSNGVYIYRLLADGVVYSKKLLLMK